MRVVICFLLNLPRISKHASSSKLTGTLLNTLGILFAISFAINFSFGPSISLLLAINSLIAVNKLTWSIFSFLNHLIDSIINAQNKVLYFGSFFSLYRCIQW